MLFRSNATTPATFFGAKRGSRDLAPLPIPPEYADGVHVEADFIAAIRGERQPARAVPRFEDARQLLQFGEVWKESSQKGGWCDLP